MTRRIAFLPAVACLMAASALAYIRVRGSSGAFASRPDFTNVQFFLNQEAVPGLMNADGKVIVTADSDLMGAVRGALAEWNGVTTSAAHFADIQTAPLPNNPLNGSNIIIIADSPAIRSLMGPALTSDTLLAVTSNGIIVNSVIVLNPLFTYSTTGAPNTFDLQSVLAKQLGGALGAADSPILGAAIGFDTQPNTTVKQALSPEDIAFVTAVYPADLSGYGTLSGTLTMNGAPLRNVLISAVDGSSGTALSALTYTDGEWSVAAPPGNYLIYAQPLSDIFQSFLGIPSNQPLDRGLQPSFLGGNGSPTAVSVTAGNTSNADFSPSPSDGSQPPALYALAAVPVGSPANIQLVSLPDVEFPTTIVSGQTVDIAILGPGIDPSLSDANIMLLGPLALQPGSVRQDKGSFPFNINGATLTVMRFTVNIPAVTSQTLATLVIANNGNIGAYTGGLVLLPPPQQ